MMFLEVVVLFLEDIQIQKEVSIELLGQRKSNLK